MNNSSPSLSCVLRDAKEERCRSYLYDGFGFCAVGVLAKHLGWTPVTSEEDYSAYYEGYTIVVKALNNNFHLVSEIYNMNDDGKDWSEIADYLQEKGY